MIPSKKAIVLGGTNPHIELINNLKGRGYYTILVDYLDNPPAKNAADLHIKESTLDKEAVFVAAKDYGVSLVISTCIDQSNATACFVGEKLGLPIPYSYQTAMNVTNKGLMKRIMQDHNIPTSWYLLTKNEKEIDFANIVYPAVVKPVDCLSSKGVHRVDNDQDTIRYVKEALSLSRTQEAIIEGFNEGEEIQVDCFASKEDVIVVMTRQKQKIASTTNNMVIQSYGSIIPAPLPDKLDIQAREIAIKISKAFGLQNTPFFYQAIVTRDGIKVLELAPRIGGGLSHYLLKELAQFNAVDIATNSFLGIKSAFSPIKLNKCYATHLLYAKPCVFDHISGLEELKAHGAVKEYFVTKNRGTLIDSDMRSSNRVGAFVLEADNYDDLHKKAKFVYEQIEIYDIYNEPKMNRVYNN